MTHDPYSESNRATYSPEDNKLRLYVGRVPRDEYEALRREGWTSTPKQDCDFVAAWTPGRSQTCITYAGIIEDEDQGPEDRAADRAERFGGYRDKRTSEAIGHADRYDGTPTAHGYQSAARAIRSASRHDRIAGHAVDAWSKAEYWQQRTAGVIAHALYVSRPDVRMGRIKTIEAELRKCRAGIAERLARFEKWQHVAALTDPAEQRHAAYILANTGSDWTRYEHPRPESMSNYQKENGASLYDLMTNEKDPITGAEAVALFFSKHSEPATETEWTRHYTLRLAYENQMLEAQGGRAAHVEMIPGGFIGGRQIHKVNKSPATGRVVSVHVKGPAVSGWTYKAANVPGTDYALYQIDTERLPSGAYRPPTDEELSAFTGEKKAKKAASPKIQFINPTKADAERLQAILNARAAETDKGLNYPRHASEIEEITQARFSNGPTDYKLTKVMHGVKLRFYSRMRSVGSVVVLTDKPQKPLPASFWLGFQKAEAAETVTA